MAGVAEKLTIGQHRRATLSGSLVRHSHSQSFAVPCVVRANSEVRPRPISVGTVSVRPAAPSAKLLPLRGSPVAARQGLYRELRQRPDTTATVPPRPLRSPATR